MCARYSLSHPDGSLAELFDLAYVPELPARWNVAPTQTVPVVVAGPGSGSSVTRRIELRRWGLVPAWAEDPSIGVRMINARSETAAAKPSFRAAMKSRRCLVPADGFYEWRTEVQAGARPAKRATRFGLRDGAVFAFAGIWERWVRDGGEPIETVAILTTSPNALVAEVHDRMPVILPRESHAAWLDPEVRDAQSLLPLLGPFPAERMSALPVSRYVNDARHEGPQCWDADRLPFNGPPVA